MTRFKTSHYLSVHVMEVMCWCSELELNCTPQTQVNTQVMQVNKYIGCGQVVANQLGNQEVGHGSMGRQVDWLWIMHKFKQVQVGMYKNNNHLSIYLPLYLLCNFLPVHTHIMHKNVKYTCSFHCCEVFQCIDRRLGVCFLLVVLVRITALVKTFMFSSPLSWLLDLIFLVITIIPPTKCDGI